MRKDLLLALSKKLDSRQDDLDMNSWDKCAIKLACDLPEWRQAGFSMTKTATKVPVFQSYTEWRAVAAGLEITHDQAVSLFIKVPGKERPKDISQRIKTFIEGKS